MTGDGDAKATNSVNDAKTADGKAGAKDKATPVVTYQFAQKPDVKPGWEGFKQFLWNSETKQFLGRTGCSWFKIGLYYLIFYAFLTGFFIAMLVIFYQTLDDEQPKWQLDNGIIGNNPGMGFRPMPDEDKAIESTLIWFRSGTENGNWKDWTGRLDTFLADYKDLLKTPTKSADVVECAFGRPPGPGQICAANATGLLRDPCSEANHYGYKDGNPCVLIKLNKIYGWEPKPYANSSELPETAPQTLKDYVKEREDAADPMVGHTVWMSCEGENPADRENIGKIEYFPSPGVPSFYFPYKNQQGYLSPAVFAHFLGPKHGVLISVECKAWARNIRHDSMERMGSVHFELMVD